MGVKPALPGPAIEAMSGLTAHDWVVQYLHMSAFCEEDVVPRVAVTGLQQAVGSCRSAVGSEQ
ncbi:MAG: hypothetical protein LBD52_02005 [Prevotellaceae bacterium]|jgi:hypothetical protein|nr:hypothetical protein [Prevotellaceae bacterium]